jgi:hypothetical protein
MQVPERIWLKTANAPNPRAASVQDPANASAGLSTIRNIATAKSFFMAPPGSNHPVITACVRSSAARIYSGDLMAGYNYVPNCKN